MKFRKKVLDNGLTVIFEKRDVPVTTVMLAVKYGFAYEIATEKGIAHFIEHLCFKGTKKRTVNQIAGEIEGIGGDLNAFTHEEITAYHARVPSKHLDIAADVIFDIFFNASFPEEEIEKEGNVICEEIKMYRDNPRAHVMEKIKENLFEIPFGMNGAGTESIVRGLKREDLYKRHREVYVPENAIFCVVGNNNFEDVVKLAKRFVVNRVGLKKDVPTIKKKLAKGEEKRDSLNQTNLVIGVHFPSYNSEEKYSAELFSSILGEGMSSRLFREVREKRGLVYGVKSGIDRGKNYGFIAIWAGTDPKNKDEVIKICENEFKKMESLSESELNEAKIKVIGNRKVETEGSVETAINLIIEEIRGNAKNYYSFDKNINKVKLENVRKLARVSDFARFSLGP